YNKLDLYKLTPQIFADIHDVINWVIETQSYRLLKNNLSLFGRSYGGAIVLTHGYIDKNVNKIIALCARYDYLTVQLKISEDLKRTIAEKISPKLFLTNNPSNNKRIMLVHCKDDKIIPFENIIHIKEHLGLNDSNLLIYEKGGHSFEGLHNEIFRSTLEFLKKI
ncbi:MAG: alpha/beta hydrolase family protein, partial [Promethearchaeota archaeon]